MFYLYFPVSRVSVRGAQCRCSVLGAVLGGGAQRTVLGGSAQWTKRLKWLVMSNYKASGGAQEADTHLHRGGAAIDLVLNTS